MQIKVQKTNSNSDKEYCDVLNCIIASSISIHKYHFTGSSQLVKLHMKQTFDANTDTFML